MKHGSIETSEMRQVYRTFKRLSLPVCSRDWIALMISVEESHS